MGMVLTSALNKGLPRCKNRRAELAVALPADLPHRDALLWGKGGLKQYTI